ncbi:MAG: D-alanine--D-alanine ligase [Deltaproteobacteria bacterium]|nr:D-alanine--D-alanine ligase [Deltaproteobacteria bacterium]
MATNSNVVILHNAVSAKSTPDELDVLDQVNAVSDALQELGFTPVCLPVTLNLKQALTQLQQLNPLFAFNLFESVESSGRFIYFASAVLDHLQIPYTGSLTSEIFVTTNKIITKEYLTHFGIPTPEWTTLERLISQTDSFPFPCIAKPIFEDASVGLDSASVFRDAAAFQKWLKTFTGNPAEMFVEEFVDGREFNISVLASPNGPEVLPPAEIRFIDFPDTLPRIVGYRAKWEAESFECTHTVRSFDYPASDAALLKRLMELSLDCWQKFRLKGYVRVDFRVRSNGRPEVLEINANPCISPDSGFVAACQAANISYTEMIRRVLGDIAGIRHRTAKCFE